jgi:hypothetical protein
MVRRRRLVLQHWDWVYSLPFRLTTVGELLSLVQMIVMRLSAGYRNCRLGQPG